LVIGVALSEFLTVYGFLQRKRWSYMTCFILLGLAVFVSAVNLLLLWTAPAEVSSDFSTYVAQLMFGALILVIIGSYIRGTDVKEWLNVEEAPQGQ
jgi:uncharacterized membrane protein